MSVTDFFIFDFVFTKNRVVMHLVMMKSGFVETGVSQLLKMASSNGEKERE